MHSLDRPLSFDIEHAPFKRAPWPTFDAMRAEGPVIPIRMAFLGKVWVTTTYEATQALVKDNALFVQEGRNAGKPGVVAGFQWWMPKSLKAVANSMLQKDEPDHRRLRKLVDKAFARRDVLAMRDSIDRIADTLLDRFEGRAEVDLVGDFSRMLPLEVISDLLGLPHEDRPAFAAMARRALAFNNAAGILLSLASLGKMLDYVRGQIEAVRRDHRPGLIAELVRAEEEGDKLDASELLSTVILLLIAGFETTTHLISDSVLSLEQHPDQKAWLLADPAGRMERAVEELARYNTPVQSTKPRYVAQDTVFFGQPLKRGELIMALIGAANADPAEFEAPAEMRLERFPNPHMVFSSGVHFCLGQQLARVETQSALTRLYARFPNLQLAEPDRLDWLERLGTRGVKTLPLRLNGAARRLAA